MDYLKLGSVGMRRTVEIGGCDDTLITMYFIGCCIFCSTNLSKRFFHENKSTASLNRNATTDKFFFSHCNE